MVLARLINDVVVIGSKGEHPVLKACRCHLRNGARVVKQLLEGFVVG